VSTPPPGREGPPVITPKRVAGFVLLVLAIAFAAENTRRTRIRFIVPAVTTWVWLALLLALVIGFAAGALFARRK
jgi:uncharacterized integral membrane protein